MTSNNTNTEQPLRELNCPALFKRAVQQSISVGIACREQVLLDAGRQQRRLGLDRGRVKQLAQSVQKLGALGEQGSVNGGPLVSGIVVVDEHLQPHGH